MSFRNAMALTGLSTALLATFMACDSEDTTGLGGSAAAAAHTGTGASSAGGSGGGFNFGAGGSGADGAGNTGLSGGGHPDGGECAGTSIAAEAVPAALYILVDRTGSMRCNPPPTQTSEACELNPTPAVPADPSKWSITRDALSAAFVELETSVPLPALGVAYFNADNYCGFPTEPTVDIAALSGDSATDPQLTALQDSLQAVTPQGYTPIIGTTMGAYAYLHANAEAFPGNRFVVLLTDGAETCDPANTDLLVQKSLEASWVGIRTFVLGAPGSEGARGMLSQIAFNGGTASTPDCDHSGVQDDVGDCHMDMTLEGTDFATALAENLARISVEALSCVFDVPQPEPGDPPVDLGKVNVTYSSGGGEPVNIPQDPNVACDDPSNQGWQYINNSTQIEICGALCDTIKNDPEASVSIALGCQTQVVPR
jgi:hypothetical protein